MVKNSLGQHQDWSEDRAAEVEHALLTVVNSIPGVTGAHGASNQGYGDYKVHFGHTQSIQPTHGYCLEYKPESKELHAWSGGLSYPLPAEVRHNLSSRFSQAQYSTSKGVGQNHHHWNEIEETDLQA